MNYTKSDAYPWLQLQTWRFLWLHLIWFAPLSYSFYHYQGSSYYITNISYIFIIATMLSYAAWQAKLYRTTPSTIRLILSKLSKYSAPPIYIIFNLTQAPIKINTHFTDILAEDRHFIRWYQSPDAEFLELSPHAIVSLNFQKKLLSLLLRHIARRRFHGVVIQISSETLMQQPPFNTVRKLIQYIDNIRYKKNLPYQIMIYNDQTLDADDAVILRPETHNQKHPKLWQTLRPSFQDLIEAIHLKSNNMLTEPTQLDLMMDPIENLLKAITENTEFACTAIHLIGFSIPSQQTYSNPLLNTYHHNRWPNIISKTAIALMLLSAAIVLKEHYDLRVKLSLSRAELQKTDNMVLTHQLLAQLSHQDAYWSNLIQLPKTIKLENDHIDAARELFIKMPENQQIENILSALVTTPEFINPSEVTAYHEKISKLVCTLKQQANTKDCLERSLSLLIHEWTKKQLNHLEKSLLPIDINADIEASTRLNQLDYLLKHPEIIGEHVHSRLGLLESMLRQHPNQELQTQQSNIQDLVSSFKESGSYQALQYIFDRHSNDKPIPYPTISPINTTDQNIINSIIPQEKNYDSQPDVLQDTLKGWDLIYRSYLPLQGCFPLHQSSTQDCDPSKFVEFFQPNSGTFDRLWQKHIEPLVAPTTSSDTPTFLPTVAPYLSNEIIDRYMQIRIIQSVFFTTGQASLSLRFRPEISQHDLQADLKIHDKSYHIHANQHTEIPVTWNYITDQNLSITIHYNGMEENISYMGPWGLLRLIRNHLISSNNHNYIDINALNQHLRLTLIGHPHLAPWYTSLYDNFDLPVHMLISNNHSDKKIDINGDNNENTVFNFENDNTPNFIDNTSAKIDDDEDEIIIQ